MYIYLYSLGIFKYRNGDLDWFWVFNIFWLFIRNKYIFVGGIGFNLGVIGVLL